MLEWDLWKSSKIPEGAHAHELSEKQYSDIESRKVFHGQRGGLRQRYREGQEDQLGALGLVVNALILWTTRYMDAALTHLRATGAEVRKEDLARLSPLCHKHFNMLGRYHFAVPEEVLRASCGRSGTSTTLMKSC
jgi:hypothetical protein